ncbi:MAG: AAA family ATPase [Devosiaceae bacterium]|nr:AAA family ATPase [Devosiaceae bacterium]
MNRFVLISGCSGGGKSSLLAELNKQGHSVIEEPGRRIIAQEKASGGTALPWGNMASFANRAVEMSRSDLLLAHHKSGIVFFDRGLVDAAVALQHASGLPYQETLGQKRHYSDVVFLAPPWPDIYSCDKDRRHDFNTAIDEFERLQAAFIDLGYNTQLLPKTPVTQRAEFVLKTLE